MKTLNATPVNDQEFFRKTEADTPAVAADLLKQLGVPATASRAAKVSAVREWLQENSPHLMLRLSLKRHRLLS